MRRLPPLNAVRAFEAAARHVSFTKAAAELRVTHGAVSRQVAGLEDAFHRSDVEAVPLIEDFCRWLQALGQETETSTERWARGSGRGEMSALPMLDA